ncbi:MAG TPA: acylase [Rhizomicrobium sp.]|jgi:penicillin amidase/acyl-homoserine-lactone acylase|nr:acylase [Rhizomicrobium sp.]
MRYLKIGAIALVALVVVALGIVIVSDRMAQPAPPDPATLIAKAARYDVHIRRDNWGVPHILGKTDADVAFGIGFAHSEDDFATIQDVALASRGTLAAANGPGGATTDYLVHLFRVWENINARYEKDLPADVRRVAEAYADGVNYYAALHPDKVKPGLLPLTGKDVAAGFVFKTPFFYGLDAMLRKLNQDTGGKPLPEIGSNGIAVGPHRSADGATRLLVNSHQPYTGPVAWYEAVLQSGEGWHVAGGLFPGSPFMLHGHNAHLGWANTVNAPDLADVYKLTINPANDNQYRLDGKWRDFEKSDAAIRVKLFGPLFWTFHRDVLWSAQGPVFKTDHGVFAIRYAGMNEIRQMLQYYRLNKARDLDEWKAAMRLQALPSINYIYADEKGTIGYVYNGQFPVRKEGFDWRGFLPGDRSDLIWHAYVPFDKIPQLWNPKSDFVFNSNNTPFQATAPADDLKPSDFSPTMGIQTNMTNRAWRALETFGADPAITADQFRTYKFDLSYSVHSDITRMIAEIESANAGGDADLKQAQAILKAWNRKTDIHNRGTALAVLMGVRAAPEEPGGPWKEAPLDALKDAMGILKTHFGRLDPEWGQVNRFRRGAVDLPIDGGPDIYRAVYGKQQDDGTLTAVDGDTFIMFVTWDKAGKLSSQSIHQFGSATLDESSPHYADQSPLFVKMQLKPVLFDEDQLKGHIESDYRPGPR